MPYYIKRKKKATEGNEKPKVDKSTKGDKKVRHKSAKTLVGKLDDVFSKYIRLRDSRQYQYKFFRCISCGQLKPYEQADCGHYYSRTKMSTRFSEDNCNAECRSCNRFSADHLIGYRAHLSEKIGQQRMDMLMVQANSTKHWMEFELEHLIEYYTALVKEMERERMGGKSKLTKSAFQQ